MRAWRSPQEKISAFVGIENAYPLGDEIELLSEYYRRGARYIGLTHFANNQIADSSTDPSGPKVERSESIWYGGDR
ncbi:MAG: hypothetical protein CM1200mP24_02130 [Gammaproteobacteria bacterium]|nr:MAG: hypothetical protein CM1200mP24_02130 [Gammaproteobacteria bacterium]